MAAPPLCLCMPGKPSALGCSAEYCVTARSPAKIYESTCEVGAYRGALAAGFDSNRWTLKRVRQLIWRRFRVRFHYRYLERPLKALGFSVQYLATRARERDELAIARWPHEECRLSWLPGSSAARLSSRSRPCGRCSWAAEQSCGSSTRWAGAPRRGAIPVALPDDGAGPVRAVGLIRAPNG